MRYVCVIFLLLFQSTVCFADCSGHNIDFYPLYYNALQLSHEQISETEFMYETHNTDLKQILDRRQRAQLKIIKHLENFDNFRKEKNYKKLNPRMSVFGNLNE